jgi:hypothetical protein
MNNKHITETLDLGIISKLEINTTKNPKRAKMNHEIIFV